MRKLKKSATKMVEIEGYEFKELSKDVQQKLIEKEWDIFIDTYNENFQELICDEEIKRLFPNSEVEYIYSLSYSQGDGFGLTGIIDIDDAVSLSGMNYTSFEKDMLYEILEGDIYINNRQSTCFRNNMIDLSNSFDEVSVEDLYNEWNDYTDIDVDRNFNAKAFCDKNKQLERNLRDKLADFCSEMEDAGYNYLYKDCREDAEESLLEDTDVLYDINGNTIY